MSGYSRKVPATTRELTARIVTHHGFEALTGPKKRERWQKSGLIPQPCWVRVDRSQVGFYPEPVLARVAIGAKGAPAEDAVLERLGEMSEQLYAREGFRALLEVAHEALFELRRDWSFAAFLRILAEREPDVLELMNGEVRALEVDLAHEGVVFGFEPGRIIEVGPARYRVQLRDGQLTVPHHCAVEPLELGAGIVVDRVGVGSVERRFLFPALPEALQMIEAAVDDNETTVKTKEQIELPVRLGVIVARKPVRARDAFGVRDTTDPREQFNRGFIPALHISGDKLPDPQPTSALRERVDVPAFG